jgi:outer membrane protein TolC
MGEREVISVALEHYPGLRVSLTQLQSAEWGVTGEKGRYGPVLVLDESYTRNASQQPYSARTGTFPGPMGTPVTMTQPPGVSQTTSQKAEVGAELKKHLLLGTDLSLRVSGGWNDTQNNRGLTFVAGNIYYVTTKFQLTQPLLRGAGRDVALTQLRSLRAQRDEAEYTRDRVASELLRDVLGAYWELWYAERAIAIEEASKKVAEQQRDLARARVETGSLARADVLSFETEVAQRAEAVLAAQGDRLQREHDLKRLLGVIGGGTIMLPDVEPEPGETPGREAAEQDLLAESRSLRELNAALERARIEAKTASDPLRSRLDLSGNVQVQGVGNNDIGNPVSRYATNGAVSAFVSLTYEAPLDGRQYKAAAAQARLSVEVAEEQLADARNRELTALHQALSQHETQSQVIELTRETVAIAEQQLAAQQARFASGSATPLDVIQAEDGVRTARLRVARAQADLRRTALSIDHSTGRLLSRYASLLRTIE